MSHLMVTVEKLFEDEINDTYLKLKYGRKCDFCTTKEHAFFPKLYTEHVEMLEDIKKMSNYHIYDAADAKKYGTD